MTPDHFRPASEWDEAARRVVNAPTHDFPTLIRLSGLDPKRHLRFADWSHISFRGADLRGFDFTGARLINCDFADALIEGARFDQAEIDHASRGRKNLPATKIAAAKDWPWYVEQWTRSTALPADDHLPVGAVFQDAPLAPEMVVVPAGSFLTENAKFDPVHPVRIETRFAVGRFPVRYGEWQAALVKGGVPHSGPRSGPKPGGPHPIVFVSWDEVKMYTSWLAKSTGKPYRLLSEAEWEYCYTSGNSSWRPDPADIRFPPNAFGFHHSYVHEWCEDIWLKNCEGPPSDGSPRLKGGDLRARVVRAGAVPSFESSFEGPFNRGRRTGWLAHGRSNNCGFRVARALTS